MSQGSVHDTTGYVNYVYNISARGITQLSSQLLGLSGVTGQILGQLAFQTTSYLSETEGALMTMGVAASVGLTKATQQAMEFDQALSTISAISGKSGSAIDDLGEQAMDMSERFGMAVGEMTTGLEALARAGVSAGNMGAILEQAMGLSKLEGLSLETSINDLISTTNLLDIEGLDLESPEYAEAVKKQNQRITATSEAAPINARDIIHTLEHVGGYASSTKLDQEDLFAVIAQLGSKGTKSEMAGTSLRAFLAAGQKDTAQRALKRIGLNVKDLWKNDEQILSISDMKDVLDEAMESKGYTQQEKLEFYSDFAGYKQANQIMKIDTTSVREFKDKIDRSWDISKKIETVIGTAETNFQGMVQAGINFLTKVGKPLLPVVSTVSWVVKNIIGLIDKIPGSHLLITSGMILVAIKSISTIFNKVGPQLLDSISNVATLSDFFNDIRENLDKSFYLLKNISNVDVLREEQFENEINRIDDKDRIEYYQSQGYDVRSSEEIIKLRSKADDQKIIDLKRQRLMDALNKKQEDKEADKDERVGKNRKTAPTKKSYDQIIKPIEEIKGVLDSINGTLEQFPVDNEGTTVLETTSNVDLSKIEDQLMNLISVTGNIFAAQSNAKNVFSIDKNLNVEAKAEIDNAIISDLKRHIWKVEVVGPVATLTKKERDEKWRKEGWTMDDFFRENIHRRAYASTGQSFGGHSRYSYHGETYEDYHMSSDAQRRKGKQKQADARRARNQRHKAERHAEIKEERDAWRTKVGPVYGETPTPDYDLDGSYGFNTTMNNAQPRHSNFDVGVKRGDFRTAKGRVSGIIRKYDRDHKDAKIGSVEKLTDIFLEDPNSPVIKEIRSLMTKSWGDQADKNLSDLFKQMAPIRTRGTVRLSDSDFIDLKFEETGSETLDFVGSRIGKKLKEYQDFMNKTGFSFSSDLDIEKDLKELEQVRSQILNIFGQARLNLTETSPQELQDVILSLNSTYRVPTKSNIAILADAFGLFDAGSFTKEDVFSNDGSFSKIVKPAFESKVNLDQAALVLGSIYQSPLMQSLESIQATAGIDDSDFLTDLVSTFNETMAQHSDLQLSMRGLQTHKTSGKLIKGNNKLENIIYSLAVESAENEDQDALASFIIDLMSNMQQFYGISDDTTSKVVDKAKRYDTNVKKSIKKELAENPEAMLYMSDEEGIFTIEDAGRHSQRAAGIGSSFQRTAGEEYGSDYDPHSEMYEQKFDEHDESYAIYEKTKDKDLGTVASSYTLQQLLSAHGTTINDIAEILHGIKEGNVEDAQRELEYFLAKLSRSEDRNQLLASFGLEKGSRVNIHASDPSAVTDNEYYNTEYGRNTAFFNGVELGTLNPNKGGYTYHVMKLFEDLDPLLKKMSAIQHELQLATDIDFLRELGLLEEEFEDTTSFLRAIHHLIADVHVKGKALQSRHRGYRGLGDADTPGATTGIAIREQGNIAENKNVGKILPHPDTKTRNYVKERLENRPLSTIVHMAAPLRTRAALPETGGMKLGIKHITTGMSKEEYENSIFSEIPWLMMRAKSPGEVMYALDGQNDKGDIATWLKNEAGNYANIWTPEAMLKRTASIEMGNVIQSLGSLALYDKTSGEEGDEHIITQANVKDIVANNLSDSMLDVVNFMYQSQGFSTLKDLKLKAGSNYDEFSAQVRRRMDTAGPEEGFEPDEQANNQFKRWVNDEELERLKREGLFLDDNDFVHDASGKAIKRMHGEGDKAEQQHLIYDWEALRLSKEEIGQQYVVMMMANAMLAQETITKQMAAVPEVFNEFAQSVQGLSSTVLSDPRQFLSMNSDELIAYGATSDTAFHQIREALDVLTSSDVSPEKITALLQDVTVGDLGDGFISQLTERGYYTELDDETLQATNVATIAESFGGTYELIVDILKGIVFSMSQIREMNDVFDSKGVIAQSVQEETLNAMAEVEAQKYNTDAQKELATLKENIDINKNNEKLTLLPEALDSTIPYKLQDNSPDMWKQSFAPPFVDDVKDFIANSVDLTKDQYKNLAEQYAPEVFDFVMQYKDRIIGFHNGSETMKGVREDIDEFLTKQFNERARKQNLGNILEQPQQVFKGSNPPKPKKGPFLTPNLIVDINSPDSAEVWDNEEALALHEDQKRSKDKVYNPGHNNNYITPKDANIIDQSFFTPHLSNQAEIHRENERDLTLDEYRNAIDKEVKGTQQRMAHNMLEAKKEKDREEKEQDKKFKNKIKILKDIYRNIDQRDMQELLEKYKQDKDFDVLYDIAVEEVEAERNASGKTDAEIYKIHDKDESAWTKPSKGSSSVVKTGIGTKFSNTNFDSEITKQTNNQNKVINEIMGLRNAYKMFVNDAEEEIVDEVTEEINNAKHVINSTSVADMYGAQDYIDTYGEKEKVKKSLVGIKGYKDAQKDFDSETQELINQRNKAAWASIMQEPDNVLALPPSQKYQQGRAQTQNIADHIKSQVTQISNFIGDKASTLMNTEKNEQAAQLLDTINSNLTDTTELLRGANSVLDDFSNVFPPLTIAVLAFSTVISGIEKIAVINGKINSFLELGNTLKNDPTTKIDRIFGHDITGETGLGKTIMGLSGGLGQLIKAIETFIKSNLGPLLLIVGAFTAITTALDWSYKSHEKYVKQLEEEEKANKSRSKGLQTINEQNKRALMKNKNAEKEDELDRRYRLGKQKLDAANLSRTSGALNLTGAENDMLWGKYGISSALDKIQGKYESTAAEYDGTSGQIRRIKEHTTGGQNLIRGMPGYYSQAEEMVAAYYDANQLAIGVMDEYKDELGELYDAETNAMRRHPDENPRETREFQKALDKFVEATGITREHAQQYLDYMQTEHSVDNATQAMQAQADLISANTEMKIQAIAFGGNPSDVLGLNGIEAQQNAMVQAQADMIQLELSSQLWWKAVWSTITSPVRAIIAPIFAITHILSAIWSFITGNWDAAGMHMKQAGASLNVLGETATYWGAWATAESTDFNNIGQSAIDENDRANYGNAKAVAGRGGPRVPIPEDNSIFGIFPVGWPDEYRFKGHGKKDHKDQLARNAQEKMLDTLFAPIRFFLNAIMIGVGTIITFLTLKALNNKFDIVSKLPGFMQTPIAMASGVAESLYENLIPEKYRGLIGAGGKLVKSVGGTLYGGIKEAIPESVKEKYGKITGWFKGLYGNAKNKVVGLGEEGINEETDPVGAATIKSKSILEEILKWLTGQYDKDKESKDEEKEKSSKKKISIDDASEDDGEDIPVKKRKRINIEDMDEARRSPLELLQIKHNNGLLTDDEYNQQLTQLTNGRYIIDPQKTSTQLSEKELNYYTAPTDEMLTIMAQHPESEATKKWDDIHQKMTEGLYTPIENLLFNQLKHVTWNYDPTLSNGGMNGFGEMNLNGMFLNEKGLFDTFVHELAHRGLKHNARMRVGEITKTDDNYDYRASELEARLVSAKVMSSMGISDSFEGVDENGNAYGQLAKDIEKAKIEGTWKEVRMDLVNNLANQMIQEQNLLISGLINIVQGSNRESIQDVKEKLLGLSSNKQIDLTATEQLQEKVSDRKTNPEEFVQRAMAQDNISEEEAWKLYEEFSQFDYQKRPKVLQGPEGQQGAIVDKEGQTESVDEAYKKRGLSLFKRPKEEIEPVPTISKNLSQAVRMQTMMPSTVGMDGEEIAQMEKNEDIHKKALLRKHITKNEKHFKNVPKSQAVLAQILPFLGIEPEFDDEEYKRRNRGQKYGNRVTEGMSGEEIAEREKEQRKYYSKPQTYEETLHPPRDIQKEIDQEFDAIDSSNWAANHKKISQANKPQNDLVAKGRALKDIKAQYDAAGMLGQMMENPKATAYDTLNKMEGIQICDQCGHKNPADAKVCENCGARLDGKGRVGGALSNFFEKTKHTITGGEAEDGMSFQHRMQQISGMGKRHQRKNKSKQDAMEMGNMGFFADMMSNASESAEKTRTRALKICPECGHQNDPDANICEQCGARLDGRGKIGGFFADKMTMAKGKIKSKTTDKVKGKIDDTKASMHDKITGAQLDTEAKGAGLLGGLYEKIGDNRVYNKLTNLNLENLGSGLTIPGFNPNEESWKGNRVRVPIEDDSIPKIKVPKIMNPKTGKPYDLSHHDVERAAPTFINRSTEVAERMANGESFKDIAMDHLTSEGEGPGGMFGEKGGLKKVGGIGGKVGNFLQAQGGKAGKIGNIVSKGSNMLSSAGGKGAGGLLKSGLGKVAGSKIGGKVMSKIGGKLASKGVAQVASKVLAGGLAATGIGAPLAAIMASPIGGFLMEGAMNLGGKALGAVGGAVGGIGKALGFGRRPVGGGRGGGILGGIMSVSPLGMMAGAAGGLLNSVFGGKGPGNMGKAALMGVAAPLGGVVGVLGKMFSNDKQTKSLNEKMEAHANKTLEAVKEQNNKVASASSDSGGNITIQNININTADDPEAIKAMFLELIVELQEQVNPRLVSRTAGKAPGSSSTSSISDTSTDKTNGTVGDGATTTNSTTNGNQTNNTN